MLGSFYEKISKVFEVTITYNGSNPNITSDTVKLYVKRHQNGANQITKEADVTTSGASGIAIFTLTSDDMDIAAGTYYAYIEWTVGTNKFLLLKEEITVTEGIGPTT